MSTIKLEDTPEWVRNAVSEYSTGTTSIFKGGNSLLIKAGKVFYNGMSVVDSDSIESESDTEVNYSDLPRWAQEKISEAIRTGNFSQIQRGQDSLQINYDEVYFNGKSVLMK